MLFWVTRECESLFDEHALHASAALGASLGSDKFGIGDRLHLIGLDGSETVERLTICDFALNGGLIKLLRSLPLFVVIALGSVAEACLVVDESLVHRVTDSKAGQADGKLMVLGCLLLLGEQSGEGNALVVLLFQYL